MSITVAIVEDSTGICEELRLLIAQAADLSCVCVCRNAETAMARIPAAAPEVIVMDINLPDGSGIECTARLKRLLPETQILMFTIYDDTEQVLQALRAGASGYILKSTEPAGILTAIRDIRTFGSPMTPEIARKLVESFHPTVTSGDGHEALTPREGQILGLLAEGLLNKEIADRLAIKLDTVGTHLKNIYRKLHVRSRTEAVVKHFR